jgi:hypothetical protein
MFQVTQKWSWASRIGTPPLAQWSTTTNTVAVPSWRVRQLVASIPHIWSGWSVVMVPLCAAAPCAWPTRVGASKRASRIRRKTRALDVRTLPA